MRQSGTLSPQAPVSPVATAGVVAVFASDQRQRRADTGGMAGQRHWRLLVAAYRGHAGTEDAGLFATDAFPVRPEIVHVVEIHGGHDRAARIEYVDRIESTAQSDFQHGDVDILADEDIHRG